MPVPVRCTRSEGTLRGGGGVPAARIVLAKTSSQYRVSHQLQRNATAETKKDEHASVLHPNHIQSREAHVLHNVYARIEKLPPREFNKNQIADPPVLDATKHKTLAKRTQHERITKETENYVIWMDEIRDEMEYHESLNR